MKTNVYCLIYCFDDKSLRGEFLFNWVLTMHILIDQHVFVCLFSNFFQQWVMLDELETFVCMWPLMHVLALLDDTEIIDHCSALVDRVREYMNMSYMSLYFILVWIQFEILGS